MMTSQEWWDKTKNDPTLFNDWLVKQHRGESTAASRIRKFSDKYANNRLSRRILELIASQEEKHAGWVFELLQARGIEPREEHAEDRYWREMLPEIESFETGAAVGAHAELMRLERIKAICEDIAAPVDVRSVFLRILKDELFHEKAFRMLAGPVALAATAGSHSRGKEILGLEP